MGVTGWDYCFLPPCPLFCCSSLTSPFPLLSLQSSQDPRGGNGGRDVASPHKLRPSGSRVELHEHSGTKCWGAVCPLPPVELLTGQWLGPQLVGREDWGVGSFWTQRWVP